MLLAGLVCRQHRFVYMDVVTKLIVVMCLSRNFKDMQTIKKKTPRKFARINNSETYCLLQYYKLKVYNFNFNSSLNFLRHKSF